MIPRATPAAGEFASGVNPEAFASALIGAVAGVLLPCWFDPARQPHALIEAFLATLLVGLRAPSTAPAWPSSEDRA